MYLSLNEYGRLKIKKRQFIKNLNLNISYTCWGYKRTVDISSVKRGLDILEKDLDTN